MRKNTKLVKLLPALFFSLISLGAIMTGWQIGTFTYSGDHIAKGGIRGGLLGLIIGSFLSFGSFGIAIGWIWRQRYPTLGIQHFLILILGWMVIPIFILVSMIWLNNF